MRAVFAAFSGGSSNAPKRSKVQLRAQAYLRAFICSAVALEHVHLFLFLSPTPTYEFLKAQLGSHSRVHLLPASGKSGGARLQHARYVEYLTLLATAAANATKIVLADATDVVFQADPFPLVEHGLYTAEEAASYTLGSHAANAMWVRETYGDATLGSIADRRVVCSGLTMGTARAIRSYLELMASEGAKRLSAARLDELRRKHGRDLCRGFDQGIHNVLMRTTLGSTVTILPSGLAALFNGNEMRCGSDVELLNQTRLAYVARASSTAAPAAAAAAAAGTGAGVRGSLDVPPSIAVAHQYGRVRGRCQRAVRRSLTCRGGGRAQASVPGYCDVCARLWPEWLGDAENTWRAFAD